MAEAIKTEPETSDQQGAKPSKRPDTGRASLSRTSDFASRPGFRNASNKRSKATKKKKKNARKNKR